MRITAHALDPSSRTRHIDHTRRSVATLTVASITLFSVACQEPVSPLSRFAPTDAEQLLVGTDTTDLRIGAIEGTRADIRGLNNLGQTTGAWDPGSRQNEVTAYRWTPGSGFTAITPLAASSAWGNDINDAGVVVGLSVLGTFSGPRGAVAEGNRMVNLGLLYSPAPEQPPFAEGGSEALAINDAGLIVGWSQSAVSNGGNHAVLWNAARVIQDLGTLGGNSSRALDINASGQVIGMSDVAGGGPQHAFLWTASSGMQDLSAHLGVRMSVVAINDAGQIAGDFTAANGETHAFLFSMESGIRDLGTLGGDSSAATGLNNRGQVVGSSRTATGASHSFLWTPEEGMEDVTAISGVTGVRKLNDKLQTITGQNFTGPPLLITLRVVPRASQSISFTTAAPSSATPGGTFVVAATATSGLPVTFGSLSPSVCSVSGTTVTFLAYGVCLVSADQSGDASFRAAPRATLPIHVAWSFVGFDNPLENPPAFNDTHAGATLQVRFSLGGDRGLHLFAAGSPSSVEVSCTTGEPLGVPTVLSVDARELRYQAGPDRYTLSWRTDAAWAQSCRRLTLAFSEGTVRTVLFRFR